MKKILAFGLLVFLIIVLIGGCGQQQTKYVCPDGSTVYDVSYCPKSQSQTAGNVGCTSNEQCSGGVCDIGGTWTCEKVEVNPWYACPDGTLVHSLSDCPSII